MSGTPDFVYNNRLTNEGREVVEFIEATLNEAERLVEGQDVSSLNALAGPFQDYYINVRKAGLISPEQWVKERNYGVTMVWRQVEAQKETAVKEEKQTDLEARIAKVEAALTEALAALATKDAEIASLKEDDEVEPITPKPRKAKKTQEPEPAEPAAETDAEGEPDEDEPTEDEA